MSEYKPTVRIQVMVLGSFMLMVLPSIWVAGMGYMWLVEHGLKLDMDAKPQGIGEQFIMLSTVLPMLPAMLMAILISGILWMFIMSRALSWADLQYFTHMNDSAKKKRSRFPFVSDWLDRLWQRMIEFKRPKGAANPPP